jgi:serine/threonine protein kinase
MSLNNGDVFAGFTIVQRLGSGGMGEVYLAQHPQRADSPAVHRKEWARAAVAAANGLEAAG